jgi:hypothetical protein
MFRESAAWLRLPAGVAAAGTVATILSAMIHASVVDVTGIIATSAVVIGTVFAVGRRRKIISAYEDEMSSKTKELAQTIEKQMEHAIDLFYKEIEAAFQPLAAFCSAERKRYEPLLNRVEEMQRTFAELRSRLTQPR